MGKGDPSGQHQVRISCLFAQHFISNTVCSDEGQSAKFRNQQLAVHLPTLARRQRLCELLVAPI